MKPAPFAYARAKSLDDVFDKLDAHGDQARLLAGGQSLIATLNLRLSTPSLLLDINGLAELRGIKVESNTLRIGALTRHAELGADPLVARHAPLLAEAVPHIAHAAIRNRGTIGGSVAFADPAAELPACMLALEATIVAQGRGGERRIAADDFFKGLYETDLRDGELIVALEIPLPAAGQRSALIELARRHGDYAIVGLAALVRPGVARLAWFGVGGTPLRSLLAEAAFAHGDLAAAQDALAQDLDPPGDLHGPPQFRLHLARVLLGRAFAKLKG